MESLHHLLEGTAEVGLAELRETLGGICLDAEAARIITQRQLLRPHVYRIRIEENGAVRSLIVKRLNPEVAQRNQRVVRRWLPAVGLPQAGPPLLGIAAERGGQCVWHIYEDLGDCSLAGVDPIDGITELDAGFLSKPSFQSKPEFIQAAVGLIAQIHARFAEHPLLAECRLFGQDLGSYFFTSTVQDALRSLRALEAPEIEFSYERRMLLRRLRERIELLLKEQARRLQALAEFGGPETLLHGDLSPKNTMVFQDTAGPKTRLIDWDHVGVGAVSYDLSNFLSHFPRTERQWILNLYIGCMEQMGLRFLQGTDWNSLFDTAECARLVNSIVWRAVALGEGQADWAFDDLALIDQWFEMLEPVLPPLHSGKEAQA